MSESSKSSLNELTDETLVELVQRGGAPAKASFQAQAAFAKLRERYNEQVVASAAQFGKTGAEDVAQEAWIKVWTKIADHFDGRNFRGWLFRLVKHEAINAYRLAQRKREQSISLDFESKGDGSASSLAILLERKEPLELCIAKLPERQQCIVRATLQQMKIAAAAEHCGITAAQASVAKHHAIKSLRACTTREGV
ncbi:RNA polymerase sigma factor [Lacipirellula limnantheis]|nr:sigma-70 family RNA polymerase sigma factor [Lacipirellula limnantheis]